MIRIEMDCGNLFIVEERSRGIDAMAGLDVPFRLFLFM